MSNNAYKRDEIRQLSQLFKLLAEPNRLKILCGLGLGCRPISGIVANTGLSQTNFSFHLRELRQAGLVRPERRDSLLEG